jgi:hypothetical protein
MKIIKQITYSLILILAIYSCDTEYDQEVFIAETVSLNGNIELTSSIGAPGFAVGFTVTLPQKFDKIAVVTVKATGKDLTETTATVRIPAGDKTASGAIEMPAVSIPDLYSSIEEYATVEIKGMALFNEVVEDGEIVLENEATDNFTMSSNMTKVDYYSRVQWPYGSDVIAGRMTALFDFAPSTDGSARDLDMLMYNADTFENVESAASGSRWETDIFNDTHPDGDYFVAIDLYKATGNIPWKIFFVHPNQTTIDYFEGTFEDTVDGDFIYPVINFTKSTDADGIVSYVFTQP